MSELWTALDDAHRAFAYEWIEQCEMAEKMWAEEYDDPDSAKLHLWVGVELRKDASKPVEVMVCKHKIIMEPAVSYNDAWIGNDKGYDVEVFVPCIQIRHLLQRPRGRK